MGICGIERAVYFTEDKKRYVWLSVSVAGIGGRGGRGERHQAGHAARVAGMGIV